MSKFIKKIADWVHLTIHPRKRYVLWHIRKNCITRIGVQKDKIICIPPKAIPQAKHMYQNIRYFYPRLTISQSWYFLSFPIWSYCEIMSKIHQRVSNPFIYLFNCFDWGHTWLCSGITPDFVLRNYCCRVQGLNPS